MKFSTGFWLGISVAACIVQFDPRPAAPWVAWTSLVIWGSVSTLQLIKTLGDRC